VVDRWLVAFATIVVAAILLDAGGWPRASATADAITPATALVDVVEEATAGDAGALRPGGDTERAITITYRGSRPATVRLFATAVTAPDSSPLCSASEPLSGFAARIGSSGGPIYPAGDGYGDLAGLVTAHSPSSAGITLAIPGRPDATWRTGDTLTLILAVRLPADLENTYQGCSAKVALAWHATEVR
jgi:hypothetical protein